MENSNKPTRIAWQSLEHTHNGDKTGDWFWGLGIVAIGAIVLAFYFGNILFGIIIIIFSITSGLLAKRKPQLLDFEISRQGVRAGSLLYPFSNLESFWVQDTEFDDVIIFRAKKGFQDFIIIPFDSMETDPELIRDYLLDYLDEEEMEEPFLQKLMEFLGF